MFVGALAIGAALACGGGAGQSGGEMKGAVIGKSIRGGKHYLRLQYAPNVESREYIVSEQEYDACDYKDYYPDCAE
jgi:hypothetical protein